MTTLSTTPLTSRIRVLGPADRPIRPLPRWPLFAVAVTVVVDAAAHWIKALDTPAGIALFVGIVGACVLASRIEERLYLRARAQASWVRVVLAAAAPPIALAGSLLLGGLVAAAFSWAGGGQWALVFIVGGMWFSGAGVGSFVIVLIDVIVSGLVASFRARLIAAILALLVLSFGVALVSAIGFLAVVDAVRSGSLLAQLHVDGAPAQAAAALSWIELHPIAVACLVYATAGVISMPAAFSASAKLAEAVMDRIHPLAGAFDAISRGERDVHLEEGGSRDFVLLSQRFNQMVDGLALAERMERAFGSYVSGALLDRIRAQHGEAIVPASLREATVFFADIRGFTSMSEKHSPDVIVSILNRYFERVVPLVAEHQGYLNKFIGDAVVVVFNGPIDQADHAERATRCAIALQTLVAKLNAEGAFPEIGTLRVGVGVSTGPMICGNVGSAQQMEYTVIGDAVNLAARLTSHAGPGEVWVSEPTAKALPKEMPLTPLEPLHVKGKTERVVPYRAWPADVAPAGLEVSAGAVGT